MMVYVAAADLLFGIRELLEGRRKRFEFVGTDSSFRLVFTRGRRGVSVTGGAGVIARASEVELARAVLSAAEELARTGLVGVPDGDPVKRDLVAALAEFRSRVG